MVTSKGPPSRSRPVFLALLILWATPPLAQEEEPPEIRMERLEARLAEAQSHDRFELLVELTELAQKGKSVTRVVSFGEEARALLPSVGDPKRELILTSALMSAYANQRNLGPALEAARRAEELARDLNDTGALASSFKKMGDIHRYQAEHDQALESYATAHRLYETLGDHQSIGHVLNNSALTHENFGDHVEALRLYLLARQAYDKAGDLVGVSLTSKNMGNIYQELGQEDEAKAFFQQALAIAIESGNERRQAGALRSLGQHVMAQGEPERALELLQRSLKIYLTLDGYRIRLIDVYIPLGEAWTALGDYSRALDYHRRALALATEFDDQQRQIIGLSKIALVHRRRGELDTAIGLLEQAVEVAREQSYLSDLRTMLHDLRQA
ncbi:MAG: tetratricopeptide repeat protein, partial [bacterium]|nr:tetratricopeptide repeat protein [bacterium]